MSQINFYPDAWSTPNTPGMTKNYVQASHAIRHALRDGADRLVRTTQMCMLMHPRIFEFDTIRIIDGTGTCTILNRHDGTLACDRTSRELSCKHNLYRLFAGGEFGVGDDKCAT